MELAKNYIDEYRSTIVALSVALIVTWIALIFAFMALSQAEPVVYVQPSIDSCLGYK